MAVDSAARASGQTFEARADALEAMRSRHLERSDWFGSRQAGAAVTFADSRSQSVGESLCRLRLNEIGFPDVLSQVVIVDEHGLIVGVSDFAIPECQLLVEFDGKGKYGLDTPTGRSAADRVWAEKLRQDAVSRCSWELERFVWADLFSRHRFRARAEAAAGRASHRGPLRGSYRLADPSFLAWLAA